MMRFVTFVPCVVLAALAWATARDPARVQALMRNFYARHSVMLLFAPFARAVLQSDHPRLFRLAGILLGTVFSLAAVGILVLRE
jgi:hypothetical protein